MADVVGVIGGSGLYEMPGLADVRRVKVETPFGAPSDALVTGRLDSVPMVFLPRHGVGHRHTPTEVPYVANIWALKKLGVTRIISVSAVGSLREDIAPGHVVLVDQFMDRTRARRSTFFGGGIAGHVAFGDPVCGPLHDAALEAARTVGVTVHAHGTYVCMEGPQFSTRAESMLHRRDGADVVGMTNMPEAKLAREAEICYATLALATDYDCWHEHHDDVTVETVIAVLKANVAHAQQIIRETVRRLPAERTCPCASAARNAVMTAPDLIPPRRREELELLFGRYWK
ncbi:MAG: S-methyl-5'-thioadenosine phosphorylase [Deltaproteobacteria bacterium]|nr:S-methyl-5'-thioadenosine phosphorylase [Deltaproteobacteria bacterium]